MTDYIGPFGLDSVEAAQRVILSWAHSGDPADVGSARPVLAAAVSALDREALLLKMQRATTDLQRRTVAGRIPSMQDVLRASIEALFPILRASENESDGHHGSAVASSGSRGVRDPGALFPAEGGGEPAACAGCDRWVGEIHQSDCVYGHPWPRDRVERGQTQLTPPDA